MEVDEHDLAWLRRTFALALEAVAAGDQAFGALLAGPGDELLVEARQARVATGDCTAHAETLVARTASMRWPREVMRGCTLYSSAEPCPMCAGAIAWLGAGRLVFGLSQRRMAELWNDGLPPRFREPPSCRRILENLSSPMQISGPLLEDEANEPHFAWARTNGVPKA